MKNEIPEYKEQNGASIEQNQYIIDIKNPMSIASVLKHHVDNFDTFFQRLRTLSGKGLEGVVYGTINSENEFERLLVTYDADFDEEVLFNAAVSFPELLPLLEKYADLIIKASAEEKSSGPWTTEETILGEFLIPALAMKDKKYISFLGRFMKASVEVRFSTNYQQKFRQLMNDLTRKSGGRDKFQAFLDKYLCTDKEIDYKVYDEFDKIRSKGLKNKDKTLIFERNKYHPENNQPAEKFMINAYNNLMCMDFHMPLKTLQKAINQIQESTIPDINTLDTNSFEEWEEMSGGSPAFYKFRLHFSKKEEVKNMLEVMVNRFDELFLHWKYMGRSDLRIFDLDDVYHNSDFGLFTEAIKYPELEPLTLQYVKKHTEANKTFPLIVGVRGLAYNAAAALAVYNEKYDDAILEYLQSLPQDCNFNYLCSFWKDVKSNPNLPNTFNAYPHLKK